MEETLIIIYCQFIIQYLYWNIKTKIIVYCQFNIKYFHSNIKKPNKKLFEEENGGNSILKSMGTYMR